MKTKTFLFIMIGLFMSLSTAYVAAQDGQSKGQLHLIHEDFVKPSKVAEYEAALKELLAQLTQQKAAVQFNASMRDDFHYYFVMPVENFSAVDELNKTMEEFDKKIGEMKSEELNKNFAGTYTYHEVFMARLMTDLSYAPEQSRLKDDEAGFLHWDFYYIEPGKEKEAMGIAKEYKELYKSKNISDGYDLWMGDIGSEMPVLAVVQWGKNATDFYTQSEKNDALLGEAGQALGAKAMAITRKFEHINGRPRPDLSYMPAKEAVTEK